VSSVPNRLEAGFVVGFLEAEAHFCVSPANGGQSLGCAASLVARDDDAALIVALSAATGLGQIGPRAAYRTSRPQIVWTITTQAETTALAAILRQHPPVGRKAQICEAWWRAVEAWTSARPDRAAVLWRLRTEIQVAARYSTCPRPARAFDINDEFDRGYVTGLIVGDGHLGISSGGARLTVHLRDDDRPLLESLRASLGGTVRGHRAYGTSRPAAHWCVCGTRDLARLRDVLAIDLFPSRKQREFEVWSAAIDEQIRAARASRPRSRELLGRLAVEIRAARQYVAPAQPIAIERRRDAQVAATRARCLAALAEFADGTDGPLSSTVYERRRHAAATGWPRRDTVARHFGSWYAGLEAAGLEQRAAANPDRFANRSRAVFDARRIEQRERVLASLRRFIAEFGHVPRAMEYFRWRLVSDPDTPTQATVYNVFPGGWVAVLEALFATDEHPFATLCSG
jgi:hypothetical protein